MERRIKTAGVEQGASLQMQATVQNIEAANASNHYHIVLGISPPQFEEISEIISLKVHLGYMTTRSTEFCPRNSGVALQMQ